MMKLFGMQQVLVTYQLRRCRLLARGANIHDDDDAALRLAAGSGRLEMVAFLLDNGADVHAQNDKALREARRNRNTAVVALLLERAAA